MKAETTAIASLLKGFLRQCSFHRHGHQALLKEEWLRLFPQTKGYIKTFHLHSRVLYVRLKSRLMTHLVRERGMNRLVTHMREVLAQEGLTELTLKRIALL